MVVAAQMLEPEVLEALELSKLTPNLIHENKYFLGTGAAGAPKRLSAKWKLAAIRTAACELDLGKTMLHADLENEFCSPLHEAEKWIMGKRKFYGALSQIPAFARVEAYLMSPKARFPPLGCVKANMRLEGAAPDNGVEQCRILIAELEKLRKAPAETETQQEAAAPAGESAEAKREGEESQNRPTMVVPDDVERDYALEAATSKLDIAMAQFGFYKDWEHIADALPGQVASSDHVFVLLDAPTSRPKVAGREGRVAGCVWGKGGERMGR